jgi:hypothetical protein
MMLDLAMLRAIYKILMRKHLRNTQRKWEMYAAVSNLFPVAAIGVIAG